jgi:hypothetical protein
MAHTLSTKLSELSTRAKAAEDSLDKAEQENEAYFKQQGDKLRADADQRKAALKKSMADAKGSVNARWSGITGQVQANIDETRAKIQEKKDEHDMNRAIRAADDAEEDAAYAIDFALYMIDVAEESVLEAVAARDKANALKAAA